MGKKVPDFCEVPAGCHDTHGHGKETGFCRSRSQFKKQREITSGTPGRQQPGKREPITGEMIERLLQPTLLCAVSVGDLLFCPFFVFCRISGNILAAKRLYQRLYHVTVQGPFFGIILNILPDFIIIGLIADYMIIIGTLKYGFANFF